MINVLVPALFLIIISREKVLEAINLLLYKDLVKYDFKI